MVYRNFANSYSMTTKGKCTVLSIEDKITICEQLDKGSPKSEITCEYKITDFIYFMYICLIIQTFWLSEQVLVPMELDTIIIAGKFCEGKFGEFGKQFMIRQTKTIQISTY